MKRIKLFEEFIAHEEILLTVNDILESANNETRIQLEELTHSIDEGVVKQIIGWTLFPQISLLNVLYQFMRRRGKIKRMLAKETDPKKKEALRQELKTLKYEEVKAKEKVKAKEEELDDKIKMSKQDMSPEEREQFQKEMAKKRKELEKAREKFNKEKEKFHGLV